MRTDSGRYSTARVLDHWYIACRSSDLAKAPLGVTVLDTPLVLFRDGAGLPSALLDRCAHRNVPLSMGRVVAGQIECAYHGWRFDGGGVCRTVPSLCGDPEGKGRRVPGYPVREQQGYIWIFMGADPGGAEPAFEPFRFPHTEDGKYAVVRYEADFEATLHATAENILDVPHTAFLHRGLFRGGKKNRIDVVVRRTAELVEAEYVGEPVPSGVLGRLLAPGGGRVEHFDRFLMPSVAQVEYALGSSHLVVSNVLTPVRDFETRLYAQVAVKLPAGGRLLSRVVMPFALRVVKQDAVILSAQTRAVQRFGGEQFVSTAVDLLGPHILRMLKQAERGEKPLEPEHIERLEMLA